MIIEPDIALSNLILSLAQATDHLHPAVANHQTGVAYVAASIAQAMGLDEADTLDALYGGALHDVALLSADDKWAAREGRLANPHDHAQAGARLLGGIARFRRAAEFVRHHHLDWTEPPADGADRSAVPLGARILHVADDVERFTDADRPALLQAQDIRSRILEGSGQTHCPDVVEAWLTVAQRESFWLDLAGGRTTDAIARQMLLPTVRGTDGVVQDVARLFSYLVDVRSAWTTTHSAGVTATAVALAQRLGFSPREREMMRTAGYLHDLGKITVPASILDKAGALTAEELALLRGHTYHGFCLLARIGGLTTINEWASFHHERLDGSGYPFHHTAATLTLGSRIMAVADVFTAVGEDRPYRAGMDESKIRRVLTNLADNGGLDGDVVGCLLGTFDDFQALRRQAQAAGSPVLAAVRPAAVATP